MMERSFTKRLARLKILKSVDTLGFIVSLIVVGFYTNWNIDFIYGKSILDSFITVSSTFFAFILAGFTVITSFTDKDFILAWIKIGKYETVITLFQYNLYLPIVILSMAFILRFIYYNSIVMIFLISLFIYMLFSVADLVKFISNYALQRGDFIEATENNNH
ncbi:MAG: hypothetical protein PHX62_01980 [Bacilli bacterium]|nr:hypothetical protein [Bacilli bacterium]